MKRVLFIFSLAAGCSFVTGCSDVQFEPGAPVVSSTSISPIEEAENPEGQIFCETGQVLMAVPTKVILLVDQSGSNVNGPYGFPGLATDPLKNFRTRVIADFFDSHFEKPHVEWALATFQEDSATARTRNINTQWDYAENELTFREALQEFSDSEDRGRTPYQAALQMAQQLIERDQLIASVQRGGRPLTQYKIALITDGFPTDYCPGGAAEWDCPGRIQDDRLDEDLLRLLQVSPQQVELSTIYYGVVDAEASQRLARMASLGGGQFVDTNLNQNIQLNDLIQVDRRVCTSLVN